MKQEMIEKAVIDLLFDNGYTCCNARGEEVKADASSVLEIDMGMDSLDVLDLVTKVEKRFDVCIPESIYETWKTRSVSEIAQDIKKHLDKNFSNGEEADGTEQ